MKEPNIFSYAKKELSQDAFICWLLEWSENQYASVNPKLNLVSKELISAFTGIAVTDISINRIEINPQEKNIDIVAKFTNGGDHYVIAIEDKVRAFPGKDQLIKYSKKLDQLANGKNLKKIYFKSYAISTDEVKAADAAGFEVFDLKRILHNLTKVADVNSEILKSFISHNTGVHSNLYEFEKRPTGKWIIENYQGFCIALNEKLHLNSQFRRYRGRNTFWFPLASKNLEGLPSLRLEIKDTQMIITSTLERNQYDRVMAAIYNIFPRDEEARRGARRRSGNAPTLYIFNPRFIQEGELIDFPKTVYLIDKRIKSFLSI